MGHKAPDLRPRCIGPGRARTQISVFFTDSWPKCMHTVTNRIRDFP